MAGARAVVYLVHGYAEHSGRLSHVGAALAAAGLRVRALDLPGHGASEGLRGLIPRFNAACADVVQLATEVHAAADAGLPRFLLGHSMGGLVALRVASGDFGGGAWAGAVLSSPLLAADPATDTPLNRFLARHLTNLWPTLPVAPLDVAGLCTDAAVVEAYRRDPLCYHGLVRVRTGFEGLEAIADARAAMQRTRTPLLIVHGTADRVCLIAGSRELAAAVTAAGGAVQLREYPGLFHESFNEPGSTSLADSIAWIVARVADAAPALMPATSAPAATAVV